MYGPNPFLAYFLDIANLPILIAGILLFSDIFNLFLIVILAVTGVVVAGMYIGWEVISLLAVPIISVIAILIVFARLVSALIYGFAEIVEKHEK